MENLMNLSIMPNEAIRDAINLLKAYQTTGVPADFCDDDVQLAYNSHSGMVFLTNSDYDVAVYNDYNEELESWYYTPWEGHEGTLSDLIEMFQDGEFTQIDDLEYLRDICEFNNELDLLIEIDEDMKKLKEKEDSDGSLY